MQDLQEDFIDAAAGAVKEHKERKAREDVCCLKLSLAFLHSVYHEMTCMDPNTTSGSGSKHVVYRMHDVVFSKRMKMARVLGSLR